MKELIIIIKKELTELLRDKKTLINSIVLPMLLLPILMFGGIKVMDMIEKNNRAKSLKIGLVNAPQEFVQILKSDTLNKLTNYDESIDFKTLIDDETIQTAIVFPKKFEMQMDSLESSSVQVIRNGSKESINRRFSRMLDVYGNSLKNTRMEQLQISTEKLTPFHTNYVEVGEQKEIIGKSVGGFIPYIFILTMWGGCLLAGIDLVTGEKERKTIETTLSLPISKFKVLFGKTIVASLLGFIPALLNLVGLIIGLKFIDDIPDTFKETLTEMLSFQSITMILLLLLPLSLFLAGVIIALVAGASTFKEAQSKAAPLMFLLIIPLVLALMPGVEFTWATVFIPILNIGLGVKEIVAGTIDMGMYVAMLASLIAIAVAAIYFSYKKFADENAILN